MSWVGKWSALRLRMEGGGGYRKLGSELEPRDGKGKHCVSAGEYLEGEDGLLCLAFDDDEEAEENSSKSEKCKDC